MIAEAVGIPVIAHGGCSGPQDAAMIINEGLADAVAVSSILHYESISQINNVDENFEMEGNTSFIKSGMIYSKIKPCSIQEIKSEMKNTGISVRF
jgi:cyclase